MSIEVVAGFWVVSFLLICTPGMDWAYAIAAGIRGQQVLPAVGGMLLGHFAIALIVALGLGAVLAQMPGFQTALTLFGAAYLLWMGIGLVRQGAEPPQAMNTRQNSAGAWCLKGVWISGLNPKVFLLLLALLPQFSDPNSHWPIGSQLMALALMHLISCAVVYLAVGYGARFALATRPVLARSVSQLSGAVMAVFAMSLLAQPMLGL